MPNPRKTVILGVTGSIAAHRAADLASLLRQAGCDVHCVMTAAAQRFITPLALRTLSRNPVLASNDDDGDGDSWQPRHIELADRADLLLVAPATAHLIAELAHGLAGHPLPAIALATLAPVLLAPAMNGKMWLHPATQANLATLRARGVRFIGPEEGMLACGYEGVGRLWPVPGIVQAALDILKSAPGPDGTPA